MNGKATLFFEAWKKGGDGLFPRSTKRRSIGGSLRIVHRSLRAKTSKSVAKFGFGGKRQSVLFFYSRHVIRARP